MNKMFLGLLALSLTAISCSHDTTDDIVPDPPVAADEWYMTKIFGNRYDETGQKEEGLDSTVMLYNPDKTLKSIISYFLNPGLDFSTTQFIYENGKIINTMSAYESSVVPTLLQTFSYSGDKVVKIKIADRGEGSYDSLVYNDNHLIKIITASNEPYQNKRREFKWENNNVIEENEYRPNAVTKELELRYVRKYTYSNLPNPYKSIRATCFLWYLEPLMLCDNRFKTCTIYKAGILYEEYTTSSGVNDKGLIVTDTLRYKPISVSLPAFSTVSVFQYEKLN
jgi:hypothetical protein